MIQTRLLLVEDQVLIAVAEIKQLENRGYAVSHVCTGEEAVCVVREQPTFFNLILMDIDLGPGMDGTQAAEQILAITDIPVVFLSSHTEPEIVDKTEGISSYGYVVKNSGIVVLEASIKMALKLFEARRVCQQNEIHIAERERKYRMLFENMNAGFALHDMIYDSRGNPYDYRYIELNPMFEKLTGGTAEQFIGHTIRELMPETEQYWIDTFGSVAKTGQTISYENYAKEIGRYFDTYVFSPRKDQFAVFFVDITERKRTEITLNNSQEQLAATLRSIGDGVIVCDCNCSVTSLNTTAETITGWTSEQAAGKHITEIFPIHHAKTGEKTENPAIQAIRDGINVDLANHTVLVSKNGTEYQVADSCAPFRNLNNQIGGAVLVFRDVTQTYSQREQLRQTRDQFMSLVNNIPGITFRCFCDSRWSVLFISEAITELSGYQFDQLQKNEITMYDLLCHPDDTARVKNQVETAIHKKGSWEFEYRIRTLNGSVRWVYEKGRAVLNQDGKVQYLDGFILDVTDRKTQAEEMEAFFSINLDLLCIADVEGRFLRTNEAWSTTLGYSCAELNKMKFLDFVHPDDMKITLDALSLLGEGQQVMNFTNRYRCKNGSYRYIEWRSRPAGNRIYAAARDITERIRIEEELKTSTERLDLAMAVKNEGIWDWNLVTNNAYFDDRYYTMAGYIPNEFPQGFEAWATHIHPDDLPGCEQAIKEYVEGKKDQFKIEFRFKHKNGTWIWMLGRGRIVERNEHGNPTRVIGTHTDITDLKAAETEVQIQLSEKETLLKEIHHRVKNNIANIKAFLQLQSSSSTNTEVKDALQDAVSRVESMQVLYDKLLLTADYSDISIKSYIETIISALQEVFVTKTPITINTKLDDFRLPVKQAVSVGIIINELLTNVFKYAFTDRAQGEVMLSIVNDEGLITVLIHDNGVGIPNTITENSPGFGLTLVRLLVQQLQGSLTIIPENGTKSEITFPL